MDFKQIEAFVNVVRFKSFSREADATFFANQLSTRISVPLEKGTQHSIDRKDENCSDDTSWSSSISMQSRW